MSIKTVGGKNLSENLASRLRRVRRPRPTPANAAESVGTHLRGVLGVLAVKNAAYVVLQEKTMEHAGR